MTSVRDTDTTENDRIQLPTKSQLPPASRPRRLLSYLINSCINTTVAVLLLASTASNLNGPTPISRFVAGVTAVGLFALLIWVNIVMVSQRSGKPGHRLSNLQLLTTTGQPLPLRQAALRFGVEAVVVLTIIGAVAVAAIDIWLVLFTPSRRRLVDRIARTIVTQTQTTQRSRRNR